MPRRATPLILEELDISDALETNDSAVQILGDEQLRTIARELAEDEARGCNDSLDGARERAGHFARAGRAAPAAVWVSAGQAGAGDTDGAGAGGAVGQGAGGVR